MQILSFILAACQDNGPNLKSAPLQNETITNGFSDFMPPDMWFQLTWFDKS